MKKSRQKVEQKVVFTKRPEKGEDGTGHGTEVNLLNDMSIFCGILCMSVKKNFSAELLKGYDGAGQLGTDWDS